MNASRIVLLILALSVKDIRGGAFIALIVLALVSAFVVPYFSGKSTEAFERQAE
ncbi:hypothetical protein ACFPES_18405 [Paenibacillus sp. GCM10023248]|uniref:hypothetical protein n=1 Tax=unclassified Paenibacillus TaxID=185978 RepID=UPI002378CF39|nr:hypothetical protein [Paenibacillus sp. MAHUQ-63]MDD9269019.1 hypothetical protein [Paenibacillus sp. MAHUQ-63]